MVKVHIYFTLVILSGEGKEKKVSGEREKGLQSCLYYSNS